MPVKTKPEPDVLTVEEARKRLRIGRNAIYDAIARSEVPSIRLGRKILVPRLALEALLRGEGRAPSTTKAV
jgi:excisionase family DNA binding protein